MKKIDKTKILSAKYKNWEEDFEKKKENHPEYNSSANKYYLDVVMNLLNIQRGLCAYTEMRLCSNDAISENKWKNGRYSDEKPEIFGQLDHFNPELKDTKGWLWDNFFFVDTDINTKVKRKVEIDEILKPDTVHYDEDKLLEYNCEKHIFFPNSELPEPEQQRIKEMILKLGINFDPVVDKRRRFLADKIKQIEFRLEDWNSIEIDEFPTAFKMCKIQNQ
ncbi:MAG: hypothetical protein K8R53_09805 [Bacteroidales bacterium]|nr:hypothetical protein [Bacteroidales bacterium]